jgi:hypothetical protein
MARQTTPGPQRDQLLEMAKTWDDLAADRSKMIHQHPELGLAGEHEEEAKGS